MQPQRLGPYRIIRKLGEGGMGAVYEAVDDGRNVRAAVKVLPESLGKKQGFRTRFEIEIEALRKLEHPNIVKIIGFGEQDGTLFYAMELVDGQDLESVLETERRLPTARVIDIGIQLAKAIKHAHDRGIIHRDIKPANIMILCDGTIKLSDFGIAKRYGNTGLTMEGGPIGTANYMSPEQTEGKKATERSDLYSIGCLFYALLAGRPPFVSDSIYKILDLQRKARPEPVTYFASQTPEPLSVLIDRLLEKEPENRPANAGVLLRTLTLINQGLQLAGQTGSGDTEQPKSTGAAVLPRPVVKPDLADAVKPNPIDSVAPVPLAGRTPRSFLQSVGDVTAATSTPDSADTSPKAVPDMTGFNTRNIEGAGPGGQTKDDLSATLAADGTSAGGAVGDKSGGVASSQSTSDQTMATGLPLSGSMFTPETLAGNTAADAQAGDTLVSGAGLSTNAKPAVSPANLDQTMATGAVNISISDIHEPVLLDDTSAPAATFASAASVPNAALQQAKPQSIPSAEPQAAASADSSIFITAEQAAKADREREEKEKLQAPATPLIGTTTLVLFVLACLVSAVWLYMHQPPTADKLYDTITQATRSSNPDALEEAEPQIHDFLRNFPEDKRAAEIKSLRDEVDLIKTERRLLIRSRRLTGAFSGTPAEQIYVAAFAISRTDPETAVAQFEAFIGLFGSGGPKPDPDTEKYLVLAQRRVAQLKVDINRQIGAQLILVQQQLDQAERIRESDPNRSRVICQSIITLYQSRAWAAKQVDRARVMLQQLPAEE